MKTSEKNCKIHFAHRKSVFLKGYLPSIYSAHICVSLNPRKAGKSAKFDFTKVALHSSNGTAFTYAFKSASDWFFPDSKFIDHITYLESLYYKWVIYYLLCDSIELKPAIIKFSAISFNSVLKQAGRMISLNSILPTNCINAMSFFLVYNE